jgi:predicted DNA-binding transcriptional regulator AlpA
MVSTLPALLRERDIRGSRRSGLAPLVIDVAHSTLWDWVRAGKFPPPVKLSDGVTAWRAADVAAWIEGRWTSEAANDAR